jgi:hypothetical protein
LLYAAHAVRTSRTVARRCVVARRTRAGPNREDTAMAQNDRDFECRECGAHFDSREQLDRHTRQQHTAQAGSSDFGRDQSGSDLDIDDRDLNR